MDIIKSIEHEQLKDKIPDLKVGDTVRVHQKIKEGNRERIQVFEGIIIKKQGGGLNATFTVRKIAYGVGVEKTFLIHSPLVEKVEVVRVGKARRAKLYYLRDRIGKAAKTKARATYEKLIDLCCDDPDVLDPLRFLRQREIVHFQRFGEALRGVQDKLAEKRFFMNDTNMANMMSNNCNGCSDCNNANNCGCN